MAAAIGAIGLTMLVGDHRPALARRTRSSSRSAPTATPTWPATSRPGSRRAPTGSACRPLLALIGGGRARRPGGCVVQPDRGPRCAASTSGSPRSAWSSSASTSCFNADRRHGRLQRPRRASRSACSASASPTATRRLSVFGVPYGQLERLWYLGLVLAAGVAGGTGATSSAAAPGGRWRRCATPRSPPPSWASTCRSTRRPRSPSRRMYAGLAGVLPRARVRAHRAGLVRLPRLDRLPRDDRDRRPRLGRRRGRRRRASSARCR